MAQGEFKQQVIDDVMGKDEWDDYEEYYEEQYQDDDYYKYYEAVSNGQCGDCAISQDGYCEDCELRGGVATKSAKQ